MSEELTTHHYQDMRVVVDDERVQELPVQYLHGRSGFTVKVTSIRIEMTDRPGSWTLKEIRVTCARVLKNGTLGQTYQLHRYAWSDAVREMVTNLVERAVRSHFTLEQKGLR